LKYFFERRTGSGFSRSGFPNNCYRTVSHQEAIEKAEREFEIYREREMRMLESDFDKAEMAGTSPLPPH
jgi:hypothetical protein